METARRPHSASAEAKRKPGELTLAPGQGVGPSALQREEDFEDASSGHTAAGTRSRAASHGRALPGPEPQAPTWLRYRGTTRWTAFHSFVAES